MVKLKVHINSILGSLTWPTLDLPEWQATPGYVLDWLGYVHVQTVQPLII